MSASPHFIFGNVQLKHFEKGMGNPKGKGKDFWALEKSFSLPL